jgi:hypothetical protein
LSPLLFQWRKAKRLADNVREETLTIYQNETKDKLNNAKLKYSYSLDHSNESCKNEVT